MLPLAVVLMVAVAGGVWWFMNSRIPGTTAQVSPVPAPTGKPSIAVLPFDNMSGDTEQSYFADGITEDLITDLSKAGALFVITRNSTFA